MDDIPLMKPSITDAEVEAVSKTVESGWLSHHGEQVGKFEDEFADYVMTQNAISTSSGTSALRLALEALDIGEGDEVIVPTLSYIATVTPAIHTGADLRFVDISTDTFAISPREFRKAVTEETEAVIVSHLFGMCGDVERIIQTARDHGVKVIEDAAEALGAVVPDGGFYAGSLGDVGIFSFTGSKIMTTGQGGMVVTDSDVIAQRVHHLKHHATMRTPEYQNEYRHDEPGFNFCLTNMQSALGRVQLERYDAMLRERRQVGRYYWQALTDVDSVSLTPHVDDDRAIWWHPVAEFDRRDQRLRAENKLEQEGIDVRRAFYPLPWQPAIEGAKGDMRAKGAAQVYEKSLLLPCWPEMEQEQVNRVVDVISESI